MRGKKSRSAKLCQNLREITLIIVEMFINKLRPITEINYHQISPISGIIYFFIHGISQAHKTHVSVYRKLVFSK